MNAIKHDYRDLIPMGSRIDTFINRATKEASRVISTGYLFTCVLYYFELPETQEKEN
jgi:hypothetical protein